MHSPRARRLALSLALLSPLFLSSCSGSAPQEEVAEALKIDPPELVLRNFYTALDNGDNATSGALLSKRAKLVDPKGGSLLTNTATRIQENDGIAKFNVLKIGEEEIETKERANGETEERRIIMIKFEINFKNGNTIRSESMLVLEQLDKAEEDAGSAPDEFGWRVEGVRPVWED